MLNYQKSTQLANYRLGHIINKGAYGIVYKCTNKHNEDEIRAIKQYRSLIDSTDFIKESAILKLLDHPNIVTRLFSSFNSPSMMAIEYLPTSLIYVKETTIEERKWIMFQLFKSIEYIHSKNIWHMDIKPGNIMINDLQGTTEKQPLINSVVKLVDFGCSFVNPIVGTNTTQICTLWYRAPELLGGCTKYDSKVDIWSAGVILLDLVKQRDARYARSTCETRLLFDILEKIGTPIREFREKYIPIYSLVPNHVGNLDLLLTDVDDLEIKVLKSVLCWPHDRLTATEILNLTYFDSVRDLWTQRFETLVAPPRQIKTFDHSDIPFQLKNSTLKTVFNWLKDAITLEVYKYSKCHCRILCDTILLYYKLSELKPDIPRRRIQLYAVVCAEITGSYLYNTMTFAPQIDVWLTMCGSAYTSKDFLEVMNEVVDLLDYNLIVDSPLAIIQTLPVSKKMYNDVFRLISKILINYELYCKYTMMEITNIAISQYHDYNFTLKRISS